MPRRSIKRHGTSTIDCIRKLWLLIRLNRHRRMLKLRGRDKKDRRRTPPSRKAEKGTMGWRSKDRRMDSRRTLLILRVSKSSMARLNSINRGRGAIMPRSIRRAGGQSRTLRMECRGWACSEGVRGDDMLLRDWSEHCVESIEHGTGRIVGEGGDSHKGGCIS